MEIVRNEVERNESEEWIGLRGGGGGLGASSDIIYHQGCSRGETL